MIWDPLRKKQVADTPEERVRQWFIGVLADEAAVPMTLMMSEVKLDTRSTALRQWRADIVVYDRSAEPLAVVECKRPEVALDSEVLEQALRYSGVLGVRFVIITNGTNTYVCRWNRDAHEFLDHIPSYGEMIAGRN